MKLLVLNLLFDDLKRHDRTTPARGATLNAGCFWSRSSSDSRDGGGAAELAPQSVAVALQPFGQRSGPLLFFACCRTSPL